MEYQNATLILRNAKKLVALLVEIADLDSDKQKLASQQRPLPRPLDSKALIGVGPPHLLTIYCTRLNLMVVVMMAIET